MLQSIDTVMFGEGLERRGQEVRRRRCGDIGGDERRSVGRLTLLPQGWRRPRFPCRASLTMCPGIACVVASQSRPLARQMGCRIDVTRAF